jgi:AcrR family transcriptional regulator
METHVHPGDAEPGLRERKKRRTRETIARVALELFAERGYDETTLDGIAEAAEVSRRTIFTYYPSKEDILFGDEPAILAEMQRALRDRPVGVTTLQALRDAFATFSPSENATLRKRVIGASDALRLRERARFGPLQDLLAVSIARELDAEPEDVRVSLVAAALAAAFNVAQDRYLTQVNAGDCREDALALFDQTLNLLRSGLEAVMAPADHLPAADGKSVLPKKQVAVQKTSDI